jgi:hypothetical protein
VPGDDPARGSSPVDVVAAVAWFLSTRVPTVDGGTGRATRLPALTSGDLNAAGRPGAVRAEPVTGHRPSQDVTARSEWGVEQELWRCPLRPPRTRSRPTREPGQPLSSPVKASATVRGHHVSRGNG